MKKQVPIWPVIGLAVLILAGVAYMVVIRPKRAEAGRLDEQIAEMQMKVTAAQLASRPQQQATAIKVADVFEVSKAMPDTDDMPGIILDLNSVAGKVALLMAALPTAANAFVLAKQFDIQVEQNTASVLLSTAFSVVTVSALLVWLRVT